MIRLLLLLLCCVGALQAEKVVQCITNFPIDAEVYTQLLRSQGYEGRVEVTSESVYEEALLKHKGFLHNLLRKKVEVPAEVDKIVFFNLSPKVCHKYDLSRLPKEKLVLFMWEPKTVLEQMYKETVQEGFGKVYTWDDSLVDGVKYFKFNYPCMLPMIADLVPFAERKLCTLISSDLKGSGDNELYSQRKEAIAYFERVKEEGFEFYGRRWNPTLYTSYRGEVADKLQVLKNYRFCICYENTQNVCGYITEKIFDCFAAGVVPIYWGASNIDSYIPKGCFIDRRDFVSLEQLHAFMKGMSKERYQEYLTHIQLFLQSPNAQEFTLDRLGKQLYEAVIQ